jgi:hypothetical protein
MTYSLYVKGQLALLLDDPTFEDEQRLLSEGHEEIWYGPPTREAALDYAAAHYGAHPYPEHPCRLCIGEEIDPPAEGDLVVGQRYALHAGRVIIFKGYLCDQHKRELEPGWRYVATPAKRRQAAASR